MLSPSLLDALLAGVLGLLVGSFLNVVIHRIPLRMFREELESAVANLMTPHPGERSLWSFVFGKAQDTPKALQEAADAAVPTLEALPPLGLARPGSRCGHCGAPIRWYQNIPVLSYLALGGRCASCRTAISLRYPVVELLTAGLFAVCGWRYGLTASAALWAAFGSILLCQFLIDFDTQYLPDQLNYPLLWLGLIGSALGWTGVSLPLAIWGSVIGYLSLWTLYHLYRLLTGKEGMGYGDFKLLAALGAWLGADYLLAIVLVSSLVGSVVGVVLLLSRRLAHKDIPISFGPFLAGAGLVCLVAGPEQVRHWIPFAFPWHALTH